MNKNTNQHTNNDEQSNTVCGTNIKQEQMLRQVIVKTKMDMDTKFDSSYHTDPTYTFEKMTI